MTLNHFKGIMKIKCSINSLKIKSSRSHENSKFLLGSLDVIPESIKEIPAAENYEINRPKIDIPRPEARQNERLKKRRIV